MKSFLISGAGSGIGQAICLKLAEQEDHRLILLGRNKDNLEATREMTSNPDSHIVVSASTTDAYMLKQAFEEIELETLDLQAVIANAGIGGENTYGENDRWDDIIATNLSGSYKLVNEALPALRKSSSSYKHIVLMSSILARLGVPGYSAYCTSKAGMLGLMRSWAAEFARENILVNAICPGWVNTAMARSGIEGFAEISKVSYDEAHKQQMQLVPLQKMSEPIEIADLVGYLTSPEQTSITGQSFDINNGAIMPA